MYFRLLPVLVLLFSGKLFAYEFPITITEYIDNVKIDAYIDKDDINMGSFWVPFEGAPPLSITEALIAVEKYVSKESLDNTTLIGIELKQIPHHKKHWHYLVKVKSELDGEVQPYFFIVLMDGKVISALKEPESIK